MKIAISGAGVAGPALAHWLRRAEALGLDGARIGMAGFSAGAALTLLFGALAWAEVGGVPFIYFQF